MAVTKSDFGVTSKGEKVYSFKIENAKGEYVNIINYGCVIQAIVVEGKDGKLHDVVLGYDDVAGYENGTFFYGAFIGRCGNRIADGKFTLNGKEYQLEINNVPNHLHGGSAGFNTKVYSDFTVGENSVSLRRTSPDGEANYPGNLDVEVTYSFDDDACLRIDYKAKTDADTVVNLTNHSYFNLDGEGEGTVYDQILKLNCPAMVPINENLIPTGEIHTIQKGEAFDFSEGKKIGQDIDKADKQLEIAAGYDHTVLLPEHEGLYTFAEAKSEKTGITLKAATTLPGAQLYSANFLEGKPGKKGHIYVRRGAFCLETQYVPNAVNCDKFDSPVLKAGQERHTVTTYTFGK